MATSIESMGFVHLEFGGETKPAMKLEAEVTEWAASEIRGETEIKLKLHDGDQEGTCTIVLCYQRKDLIKPPALD